MDKTTWEEGKSKVVLDDKLKLQQDLLDLEEALKKETDLHAENREELIKMRLRDSLLDSQEAMLDIEQKDLLEGNAKLVDENKKFEIEYAELKTTIGKLIQSIDINNLLREIDIEDLQLIAKNNKNMNYAMENLITKWKFISE